MLAGEPNALLTADPASHSHGPAAQNQDPASQRYSYHRHALVVRITHWVNALALALLLMSGLQIFNAHPSLSWGKSSYGQRAPIFETSAAMAADGRPVGITRIFDHRFNTTGVLGLSNEAGRQVPRGFPSWLTVPSFRWLGMARHWHFFLAWLLVINGGVYLTTSVLSRHLSRDLVPTRLDWRSIGRSILDHVRLRHPTGAAAARYNVLQKLAYLTVIFVLLPLMILTGWAMSPRLDSLLPGWVDLLGGRQSARTLHFVVAWTLVLFVLIHVFEVLISGVWNNLRSMITGRYDIAPDHTPQERP
ncbi:MAG: cytochrome b/b6 domain-containing protein [Steroidobacterales bacterium]